MPPNCSVALHLLCKSLTRITVPSHLLFSRYPHHNPTTELAAMYINARVLRDMKARIGVKDNEVLRRAYLYVARNTTLPPQVRHQAQLQLNTFGRYTRPTTVKNRCTVSGRGRGVMSEFGLCRVRFLPCSPAAANKPNLNSISFSQFQFRLKALNGELNGVQKASW